MTSTFLAAAAGGLALYLVSWSASPQISKVSVGGGASPALVGCSLVTSLVALLWGSLLSPLPLPLCGLAEAGGAPWGVIELGVLGALVFASLPFFVLTQPRPSSLVGGVAIAGFLSLGAGLAFILTSALWVMFISFELLLLSALYILLATSKSERARDAALEMFVWTLVGSVGLLTGVALAGGPFVSLDRPGRWGLLTAACFLVGFGVKVPLWPSTSWLLKAHVEASVEFSILLSGYIVKVGVLGLHRTLLAAEVPALGLGLAALATIGLFDACSRLPAQRDLKRIVALTTVVEMNWAVVALGLGGAQQEGVAGYLCLAHCCTTTSEFFMVEVLTKRFGTRDLSFIGGVAFAAPLLWVFSVLGALITIGFPGTSLFWAKYIFFTGVLGAFPGLSLALAALFLVFLPIFFIRLWAMLWFGFRGGDGLIADLTAREAFIFGFSMGLGVLLGFNPGLVFWSLGAGL